MRKLAIVTLILLLTSLTAAEPWISEVNIDPQNPGAGEQIEVTATGEDSGRITFIQADYGDGWKTRYCDTFYTCTNTDKPWTFSLSEGESQQIRVRVADSDYAYSDIVTRTVSVEEERDRYVQFTDFPSSWTVGESEDVEAEAYDSEGNLYDQDFKIQVRERTGGSWDSWRTIATDDCYFDPRLGDTRLERCTVDGSFEPDSSREHEMAAFIRTSDDNQQIIERKTFTPDEADPDIRITSSDAEHTGNGDVEFEIGLNNNIPSSYSCKVSSNNRITSFDNTMDRNSDDEFSYTRNFDDGSYTWYMGCLDSSGELATQVVDESFSVDTSEDDYRITSSSADHTGNGNVEFEIGLNRDLPSGYTCRWSDNNRITSLDERMDRDDGDSYSAEAEFDDGSHTVYFGCLNLNGNLATDTVSESFSVETDQGAFFDVEIKDTNSPVDRGDKLEVDYRVENTGDQYDAQRIELDVEGDRRDRSNSIGLSPGSRSSGTLTWDTSGFNKGDYDITVSSEDDSDETTVEVSEQDINYRVQDVDVNKLGGGDVEFELSANRNLPSGFKCRWSNNDRISTFDTEMDRDSNDEFSAQSNFNEGTHTVYFGCMDGSSLETNKVSRTFTIDSDDYRISNVDVNKQGGGDVEFELDTNRGLPSDYSCRWSNNDRISTFDEEMDRDSSSSFSAEASFDTGSHTVYFGCLDGSNSLDTNKVSKTFYVNADDGPFFDVEITDTNSPIDSGDTLEVDYRVENTGDQYDSQRIELEVAGSVRSSRTEGLSAGASDTGTLRWFGTSSRSGEYTATISSDDSSDSTRVSIGERDYRISDADVRKFGNGDVEFDLTTNRDLPSSYTCRWSNNDRISTFDTEMDRDSGDSYSAQSNFDEGSYTVYFGCLDGNDLVTNKVSRTFTIGSEDYRISDVEVRKLGGGDVEFDLSTNRNLPSDHSCRWSNNDRISSIDSVMDRDSNDEFSAEANFDEGSHRIYFGCLDDNNQLVTNKVSRFFTIDDEDSELTLSLRSPLNGAERTPPFTMSWRSSYNGEDPEHTVYIRRHGSSESLFSSQHREAYVGEDTSYRLTRSLNPGSYDWGVKAEADGQTERRSSTFVVPSDPTERYDLNVIVEDENGDRVSGATVSADGSTATTKSNGRTSFRLTEDSYRLVASKNDYFPDDRTVNLDSDRTVTLVLRSTEEDEVFAEFDYTPNNPGVNDNIDFDGSSSQGDIVDYRWRFGDGTTGNGREVQHSYSSEGFYDVRLTVEGQDGSTDSRTRTIRVGQASNRYDLDVVVEDENGNRVTGATVSADGSTATTNSNGRTSFRLAEGNYRIVASKDNYFPDDRTMNLDSDRTVTLVLQSSTDGDDVFAEFDYSPTNPEVDEEIEFDGSTSQGDIVDYRWRFGDGTTGNGREVQHSYSSDGWYNVRLTVEGEDGSTDSRIRTVRVDGEDSESGLLEVNVEDDQDRELEDARITAMALTPNNYAVRSSDEDTETDRSSSSRSGDYRLGFELDGRDLETFTEYHSGFNRGNWDNIALESSNGDRLIFRYDLAADSRRGTYRNYQASQDVRLSSGEKEVTLILTVNGDEVKKFTSVIDVPDEHEFEAFRDGGSTEYEGRDTRVSSPSLPLYTRYTDEDGEAVFNLSPGRYTVTGTKPGYRPDRRTVDIDEGDDRSIGLTLDRLDDEDDEDDDDREDRQVDITSVQLPASVCRGNNLNARIQVENTGEDDLSFTLSASGLGTKTDRTYYLDEGDEDTKIITFSNVQGSGNQVLSFSTGYSSEERTVQVRDCEDEETEGLSSSINPSQIQIGDSIRVNGIVEGIGVQDVQIDIGGRRAQSLSTEPDGRFSTYVYPDSVGQHNLVVRSGERSNTHSIRVLPTVSVNSVTVPNDIFEGDDFEVCGNVESQTAPLVVLRKNGEIVDSKYGNGEVCFERNEDLGEVTYQVQAFNRGAYDDESRTVEIMEQGSEVRNFPDQIASVESGSGMVKVDLYNNKDELRNYEIELEGLPRTWIDRSRKEVVLNSGERATEFIYFTPKEEGTFEATLSVRTDGEEIYSENIDISSGGVDRQESLWTRFKLWIGLR